MSEQLLAIVAVLAMLWGGLWLLKRKGFVQSNLRRTKASPKCRMETLDRLVLTPQHSLHWIRVGNRTLLVGLSPSGCQFLEGALPAPDATMEGEQ